jgi:hypothetical protein
MNQRLQDLSEQSIIDAIEAYTCPEKLYTKKEQSS